MKRPVVHTARFRGLLTWMEERQLIYNKRQAGIRWPWTEDEILQKYRFCNVYREQDKETAWLRENWLKPYADHPNLWFACALFRQINWSPTLAEIGFPEEWKPARAVEVMEARKKRGEKTYTSAYMLPEIGETSKARYTVNRVLTPLWEAVGKYRECLPWAQLNRPCTLEEAYTWLRRFFGFGGGGFLAYEVVTDWRHTRYLDWAPDINTWANSGPGAKRGVCRLLNLPLDTHMRPEELLAYMRAIYTWVYENRNLGILPDLEMRDIEHSLCEYDKYLRVKEGNRRSGLELFERPLYALFDNKP
jgi:hypothetical protein